MGLSKEEKAIKRIVVLSSVPRWIKTMFFLFTMLVSLLLFSAPVLLIIADALLPSALLSASLRSSSSLSTLETILSHLNSYDFRYSLVDIPLVSLIRSAIILCVYSFCDGPRLSNGPYLAVATACSGASLVFVSLKGSYMLVRGGQEHEVEAIEVALFVSSVALAIGHIVVAYRTSCRETRKLLVYKIDIEAVTACKNGFPRYQKILQEARTK